MVIFGSSHRAIVSLSPKFPKITLSFFEALRRVLKKKEQKRIKQANSMNNAVSFEAVLKF